MLFLQPKDILILTSLIQSALTFRQLWHLAQLDMLICTRSFIDKTHYWTSEVHIRDLTKIVYKTPRELKEFFLLKKGGGMRGTHYCIALIVASRTHNARHFNHTFRSHVCLSSKSFNPQPWLIASLRKRTALGIAYLFLLWHGSRSKKTSRLLKISHALVDSSACLEESIHTGQEFRHQCRGETKTFFPDITSLTTADLLVTAGLDQLLCVFEMWI